MVFYILIGSIVLAALGVVGFLFYLLNKEGSKPEAVPVTDFTILKTEYNPKSQDVSSPKATEGSEVEAGTPSSEQRFETTPMAVLYPNAVITPEAEPEPSVEQSLTSEPAHVVAEPSLKEVEEYQQSSQEQEALEEYKNKIEALEGELKEISDKAVGQSQQALEMIESLKKENELLKQEKEKLAALQENQLNEWKDQAGTLKQENQTLQTELDQSRSKMHFLEEEVLSIKKQMGEELSRATALVEEYKQKQIELTPAPIDPQIQSLTEENQTLTQANMDFQKTVQKLKELNDHLIEKSDTLQYELTKARAQASGVERVCENYKNQIQELLKANPSARLNRLSVNA